MLGQTWAWCCCAQEMKRKFCTLLLGAAGDVYEQAVLVALKSQNEDAQESAFTQLKTFYDDTR